MVKKNVKVMRKKLLPLFLVVMLIAQCVFSYQNVSADDSVYLEITGFQMSTTLEAYRTLYSIADPAGKTEEVGLVYGLTEYVTIADMVVGSTNSTVYSYAGTTAGIAAVDYSNYEGATTYVRTMSLIKKAEFYNTGISVRAYAKLNDGTYVYSDVSTMTVYKIADLLYQGCRMGNLTGHEYLYNNILSVVDPSYKTVDYNWTNIIVPAESVTDELATEKETTAAQETTTVADGYTECTLDNNITVGQWGYYVGSWSPATASYLGGTTIDNFTLKITSSGGAAWGVQAFTVPITVNVGSTYKVTTTLNSDTAGATVLFKDDISGSIFEEKALVAGDNVYTGTFTTTSDTAKFFFDLGAVAAGTTVKVTSFSLEETGVAETTTVEQETTTQAAEETTTAHTVKNPGVQTEAADSEVASNVSLVSYISEIDTDFSSTTGNTSSNEGIEKLFDNNINTKFFTGDAPVISIAWKMERAVIIKNYTFVTANDAATYSHRSPHKWRLLGSVNGTDWTQLDFVEDGGIEAVNLTSYTYETDVQKACQFFMLRIEDSGQDGKLYYGSQLAEIYLNGDVVQFSSDLGVELKDQVSEINASATTVTGYNSSEGVENLFDGDTSTKLFTNSSAPCSIVWTMNKPTSLYSYTLTTANDNATYKNRTIKSWVLYGSNDGSTWEAIDTVTDSGMADINYADYTYIVDKVGSYTQFKLTVTGKYGTAFQLSEISLNGCSSLLVNEFEAIFMGDWDQVTATNYKKNLKETFYVNYPRQYARWGTGSEPKRIYITADKSYDGVAYTLGNTIVISVDWMNSNPVGIGYFTHELTHAAQQYGNVTSTSSAWWVENMANYGGFRYYHWASEDNVQVYEASDTSLQDWGYEAYGNNKWFFAYMDAKYPTTKASDGTITYGLIDSINNMLKSNKGTTYDDNPYDTTTPWNQLVKSITGYDCIESLRLKYVEELQSGTWAFTGFKYYADNWMTEGIEGINDPIYPMIGEGTHGTTVATKLSSPVTSGTNLCSDAIILHTTGQVNTSEAAEMLIDGDLTTKWCAKKSSENVFNGRVHSVKIDLGSKKTFNTYTLYNTSSQEGYSNMSEWEILVSEDGYTWTSVDYQVNNNDAISSYNIGTQIARYVQIKVYNPGDSTGTVRLYEFQLYNN